MSFDAEEEKEEEQRDRERERVRERERERETERDPFNLEPYLLHAMKQAVVVVLDLLLHAKQAKARKSAC